MKGPGMKVLELQGLSCSPTGPGKKKKIKVCGPSKTSQEGRFGVFQLPPLCDKALQASHVKQHAFNYAPDTAAQGFEEGAAMTSLISAQRYLVLYWEGLTG